VGVGGSYNTNAGWASNTAVVLTTFSDNTFAALYPLNSTQLQVTRFSNTGAIVASYNWGVSDLYNPAGYEFITLSTGTAVILHVENDTSTFFIRARTYTQSSGAFGGSTNLNNTALSQPVHARALAAGGFVMTNANSSTGTMLFTRRNDAFTQTAAFELVGMSGYCGSNNGGSRQNTTIIEGATWLTIIDNTYTSDNFSYHSLPYVQVDKSNFTLAGVRRRFAASTTVGSLPAPVSGYARSGSTPNSAALLAVNTQTLTLTVPASSGSTFFTTPSVVIGGPINCQCIADMLNGQFIIAYITTSGLVQFTSFSPACVPLTTVTVTSSSASPSAGTANIVKCICLGNGKLVVSWGSSASQVNYAVYSDTYALLATGNSTGLGVPSLQNVNSWNGAAGHDIAPFGNDSFVVAVCDASNNITVGTYTDSAVLVSQAQQTSPGGVQNIRIASDVSGDVAVRHFSSTAGSGYIYWFARNTTVNSIYYYNQVALSNYNQNNHGEGFALSPCGAAGGVYSQGGSKVPFKTTPSQLQLATALGGTTTFNSMGVCIGQYGEFVFFRLDGSPTYYRYSVAPSPGPWSAATVSQSAIQTVALTIANALTSGVGSQPQIINLYDNVYAISYITSGNGIAVGLINTIATTYSANLTAGVTPSGTALVPSPANGYYLAGVAATDCAAGGAGVVQINGAATLNSQYPAGTTPQAFDFNSPGLDVGVRGTIGGRNVILNGGK
jgi:hypothetical protein